MFPLQSLGFLIRKGTFQDDNGQFKKACNLDHKSFDVFFVKYSMCFFFTDATKTEEEYELNISTTLNGE